MTNQLISTKDAAEILDVSSRTVVRWIHDGRLPGVKVNPRAFAIPREAVIELAEKRSITRDLLSENNTEATS